MSRVTECWDLDEEEGGDVCARCGCVILAGEREVPEILRCQAMRGGGVAMQAVMVHRRCWEEGRGSTDDARWSPEAVEGWRETLREMRERGDDGEEAWL